MKICIVGTGYVGLVTGACFADLGHEVYSVDTDENKILKLKKGIVPFYEPELEIIVKNNISSKRLFFSTSLKNAIDNNPEIIIIAVGTPSTDDGSADLKNVKSVVLEVAELITKPCVLIIKSTVPVGTGKLMQELIKKHTKVSLEIVSNPEFLREGKAVYDFINPDRIIVGTDSKKAEKKMVELYKEFKCKKLFTDIKSSEMIKYASNAFLATKISFINEIANICEQVGANVDEVSKGVGYDTRIGEQFLNAGAGYGGSCFPKDVRALCYISNNNDYDFKILKAVMDVNHNQKFRFFRKIKKYFKEELENRKFAIWGLAFKKDTDDIRSAVSIGVINLLLSEGCEVNVHDPAAMDNIKNIYHDSINYFDDKYDALKGVDGLILLTEWEEYYKIEYSKLKKYMRTMVVFDGRNFFDEEEMIKNGFDYFGVGK